jgi:hypothetical protein
VRRKSERRVTGARRNIQHPIGRLHSCQFDQAIKHGFIFVNCARRVERGALSEDGLWLNGHDTSVLRDQITHYAVRITFAAFQYNHLEPAINPETTIALIGKADSSYQPPTTNH